MKEINLPKLFILGPNSTYQPCCPFILAPSSTIQCLNNYPGITENHDLIHSFLLQLLETLPKAVILSHIISIITNVPAVFNLDFLVWINNDSSSLGFSWIPFGSPIKKQSIKSVIPVKVFYRVETLN